MDRREMIRRMALSMGYTLSAPVVLSVLESCRQQPDVAGWQPLFFTPVQARAMEEITETVLPATVTPGAKDLGIAQTIDAFISVVFSPQAKEEFATELDALLSDCETKQGKSFVKCNMEERTIFLSGYDSPETYGVVVWGTDMASKKVNSIFKKVKALTVSTYFNTEELGERILRYEPIPGRYNGCVPYEKGSKAWSIG